MIRVSRKVASPRVVNIADLRAMAKRRLPQVVFDYLDGGADGEVTLRDNCRIFDTITFRPRNAVAVSACRLNTTVLGAEISFPAMLAPVGYSRLMHPGGEVAAARVAGAMGTGYVLSTLSGHKLEDVRAASNGPVWYQLYIIGGREVAEATIERARNAKCAALVVTIDTPIAGLRERDFRNGMIELLGKNWFTKIPFLPQLFAHPEWMAAFLLDGGVPKLANIIIPGEGPLPLIDVSTALARAAVTWADMGWIREAWRGPLVIKGVLSGDDARRAIDAGASAVVVSNHGGRQLDSSPPTLKVLPEVVAAVKGQVEVLMDGGIRRGSDIVKAVCLGARAVLMGRAYAYGLGAAGEAGVARAVDLMRTDVERTLRLLGCASVSDLNSSYVDISSLGKYS